MVMQEAVPVGCQLLWIPDRQRAAYSAGNEGDGDFRRVVQLAREEIGRVDSADRRFVGDDLLNLFGSVFGVLAFQREGRELVWNAVDRGNAGAPVRVEL